MAMTNEETMRTDLTRSDAGFSLVSVLVALIILSVGVLSISNVLTQSVAMQTIQAQRTSALTIAQTTMEIIRALDPLTVVAIAEAAVDEDGTPDVNGVFTREVTVTDAGRNLLEVTVIVTAPRSSPTRLVTWIYDGAM
jgi:Tfp pilus assembly protein PilV